jgi:hypothetical protein
MSEQQQLLSELYEGKKYIKLKFSGSRFTYNLLLKGRDGTPDCYITSIEANLFMRPTKGIKRQKYTTYKGMIKAVVNRWNDVFGTKDTISSLEIITLKEGESYPIF